MKRKKILMIALVTISIIIIAIAATFLFYYSQGGKDNYIPPEIEQAEVPIEQAESDLMKISSAIETYFAMNLEYPEKLELLVPDIIDSIPVEPAENKQYLYATDIDENFTVMLPNPKKYNVTELKVENGKIIKK